MILVVSRAQLPYITIQNVKQRLPFGFGQIIKLLFFCHSQSFNTIFFGNIRTVIALEMTLKFNKDPQLKSEIWGIYVNVNFNNL